MSKDRIKGAAQKLGGSLKEAAGKATGNDRLRAEGMADRAAGTVREEVGKAKDAVNRASR